MEKIFHEYLRRAILGDVEAVEWIIQKYLPLINKYSRWKGKLDEDMRQYIEVQIFRKISKFNLQLGNPM